MNTESLMTISNQSLCVAFIFLLVAIVPACAFGYHKKQADETTRHEFNDRSLITATDLFCA